MNTVLEYAGIPLFVDWTKGQGFGPDAAPADAGLYAQIYWPDRAVRIGQSANIRSRIREATGWARAMQQGTARASQLRRTSPLCERVKATGNLGFEYFLIGDHPELAEETDRRSCEAFLFGWFQAVALPGNWQNWNAERVRAEYRAIYADALHRFDQ